MLPLVARLFRVLTQIVRATKLLIMGASCSESIQLRQTLVVCYLLFIPRCYTLYPWAKAPSCATYPCLPCSGLPTTALATADGRASETPWHPVPLAASFIHMIWMHPSGLVLLMAPSTFQALYIRRSSPAHPNTFTIHPSSALYILSKPADVKEVYGSFPFHNGIYLEAIASHS